MCNVRVMASRQKQGDLGNSLILCQFCILKFNTEENIRISCPQSNLNWFLLCTVNFAVKLLFLSCFCMIYCVDLGEGNIRNKCRVRDAAEATFPYRFCLFR